MDHSVLCPNPLGPKARAILQAAKRCFERYGFHAGSMSSIAAEAEISVGNVYRYFANKDAVIAAIVREDLEEIAADIAALSGDGQDMAATILSHFKRTRSRQRTVLRLEILAEGARNPAVAQMIRDMEADVRDRLHSVIATACRARGGSGPPEEVEIEARMSLIGLLMDGLQMRAIQEGGDPPPRLMDHVHSLLAQVLSPAPITPGTLSDPTDAPA